MVKRGLEPDMQPQAILAYEQQILQRQAELEYKKRVAEQNLLQQLSQIPGQSAPTGIQPVQMQQVPQCQMQTPQQQQQQQKLQKLQQLVAMQMGSNQPTLVLPYQPSNMMPVQHVQNTMRPQPMMQLGQGMPQGNGYCAPMQTNSGGLMQMPYPQPCIGTNTQYGGQQQAQLIGQILMGLNAGAQPLEQPKKVKRPPPPDAFVANKKYGNASYVPDDEAEVIADYKRQTEAFGISAPPHAGRINWRTIENQGLLKKLLCRDSVKLAENFNFLPHGLRMVEGFVTPGEEAELVRHVDEAAHMWDTKLNRKTQQYGFRFDHHASNLTKGQEELPQWALQLAQKMIDRGLIEQLPNQLIVNEYEPGQGINPHADQYCFEDGISVVSLGSDITMTWINSSDYIAAQQSEFPLGSAFLLRVRHGSFVAFSHMARWRWQHAIKGNEEDLETDGSVSTRGRRISLTFRNVDPDKWATRVKFLESGENNLEDEAYRHKGSLMRRRKKGR